MLPNIYEIITTTDDNSTFARNVEDLGELVAHALRALRDCLPNDTELTTKNVSVAYVGRDVDFTMKDDEDVEEYLKVIKKGDWGY